MNVGFVTTGWHPDPGGVPSLTRDLARGLAARGHRVYVLCLDTRGVAEPFTTVDSVVDDVAVRRVAYAYHDHRRLFDLADHPQLRDVVLGWMAETPCDLVHVHHLTGFGGGILRAIDDVGQPLVMTLHDYWMLDPLGQQYDPPGRGADGRTLDVPEPTTWAARIAEVWPHLLPSGGAQATGARGEALADDVAVVRAYLEHQLALLALPAVLVTPSEAARAVFVRAGVDGERVRVVPNAVAAQDLASETAAARGLAAKPPGIRLGVLGSVLPSKGALELARAVLAAGIDGLVLEVHGEQPSYHGDSSYVDALRDLADRHACIELFGAYERADLPRILARLDGVAAPSRWEEVFGLTAREARAAGLPVLVSDRGDLPAATDGGRGGLVVRWDDQAAWIDALRAFADPAQRETWASHESRLRGPDDLARDHEALYAEVVERVTGRPPDFVRARAAAGSTPKPKRKGLLSWLRKP